MQSTFVISGEYILTDIRCGLGTGQREHILLYNSILRSSTVLSLILYLRGSDGAAYYGVASASRLLKIIGLFCKRAL